MASKEPIEAVVKASRIRIYDKKELVVRQGEVTKNINILVDGLLAGYSYNKEGKAIVDCFCCKEGDIAIPPHNISEASILSIKAIEKSRIVQIQVKQLEDIMIKFPVVRNIYVSKVVESLAKQNKARHAMQEYSGKRLYEWFLETYPKLIETVPQKYIASFLGMSEVHLSRLLNDSKYKTTTN